MAQEITIVGAGIIGLYTALILTRTGDYKITVYAKHLPGDISTDYTSPYAGGNFSQISGSDAAALEFDRVSFVELAKLFDSYGEQAGLKRLPARDYSGQPLNAAKVASCQSYIPDYKLITDEAELKRVGAVAGSTYTTYNFNSPHFLKWLHAHLSGLGVTFIRREIKDLSSLGSAPVFNCSGLLAYKLTGDKTTYPVRGQIVIVRAPHIQCNYSYFVEGQPPTYIIPRPNSGGRVILGGYYQEGVSDPNTYGHQTKSILDRTSRLCPELLRNGPLEIVDERAGLRPGRKGGARVEKEYINGKLVIHNYGAAGTGYQSGLGMALKAVSLLTPSPKL